MKIDDFCKFLGISTPTIYNWKKEKPNLYKIVMNYKDEKLNNLTKEEEEILKLFNTLEEKEREYYILDIKTRLAKKEIDKK
ncbi:hypothetical protein [Sulfurospirillum cavolei]|uniref:hypothetical protein n=1 Tax=Sulfurospirillum cavolei TaxID=366522 RepID=UPI0005AAA9EF|nr:hypothetical protein [Sulfurospirillum cavolei]